MKAIFPNAKSLQPMPNANSVHANISGNINSTTKTVFPANETNQNKTSTQSILTNTQITEVKSSNFIIFYFIGLIMLILVIIIAYKKFKRKIK
jgi:hypothetical protein